MTKRLVDLDDEKLQQVRALLGTSTIEDTVAGAFGEVLSPAARREASLDPEVVAGSAEPADDTRRRVVWG